MKINRTQSSKPFYKRGWFIAIAVIMILGSIGSGNDDSEKNIDTEVNEPTEAVSVNESKVPDTTEKKIDENIQNIMDNMKLTEAEAQAVFDNLVSVGFSSVKDIKSGAGTGVDELQSFVANCDGITTMITIEKRLTYYIGVSSIDLYDSTKGGVVDSILDYTLDDTDRTTFAYNAENYIEQVLKAPSTAEFPGQIFEADKWQVSRYKDVVTVVSYVDSQNSFGAMIRSEFAVQMAYPTGEVLYILFDGEEIYGTRQPMSKED